MNHNLNTLDADLTRVRLVIKAAADGNIPATKAVEESFLFMCKNANLIRELVDEALGRQE